MAVIKLEIKGMSCGGCVTSVKRALAAVPGVADVQVDLSNGTAEVTGESLAGESLTVAVERLGFSARFAS